MCVCDQNEMSHCRTRDGARARRAIACRATKTLSDHTYTDKHILPREEKPHKEGKAGTRECLPQTDDKTAALSPRNACAVRL